MNMTRLACLTLLALVLPCLVLAAPKADLWKRWQENDPQSTLQVDHTPWTAFLQKYLSPGPKGINRLDYLGVTPDDRDLLNRYLNDLAGTPVSRLSRTAQLPFWINLYNGLTVKVVLDHLPVDSIRDIDISPGFFASGPWDKKLLRIEGEEISLNDIEHRILRPIWQDAGFTTRSTAPPWAAPTCSQRPTPRKTPKPCLSGGPGSTSITPGAWTSKMTIWWSLPSTSGSRRISGIRKPGSSGIS